MVWLLRVLLLVGSTIVFAPLPAAIAAPAAAGNVTEMEAREAFATGKYEQALELFGKLYARTLHPTYLRNIGRSYQYLNRPDPAINTFRDYLRKAKDVSAEERAEIEGFIREMEALKREQAAAAAAANRPAPAADTRPTGSLAPTGAAPPPGGVSMTPTPPPPQADAGERPSGSRWWWWVVGGAVVAAAAVGTAAALGAFSSPKRPLCTLDICN